MSNYKMTYEGFKIWFSTEAYKMDRDKLEGYLVSFRVHNFVNVLGVEVYAEEIELCNKLLKWNLKQKPIYYFV